MHLQAIVAVAAALLAASANSLPYSNPQTHFASSFPAASSASLASAGERPPSTRSPNGAMSALISLVRRQSKQRPMMTASARRALKGKKRSSTCSLTGTNNGATNSTTGGNGSVNTGNATVGTDGSATAGNTDVGNNGTISVGVGDGNSTNKANMVTVGYWADWTSGQLAPENIAWAKYDIINYAFAIPQSDSTVQINDASMLKRMVAAAHKNGSKLVLSIGGAGQSSGYINSVSSDSAIAKFITNLVALQKQYSLDGFDFDWEYPNNLLTRRQTSGQGADTKNFQTFLERLRPALPSQVIMSAAVPLQVWQGSNGQPVGSVARAASALDYIVLMNYDVWGSSSNPGPNAPLANLCGNSTQPVASAAGGVKAWTGAGMPREKIVLGMPFYGYINTSTKKSLIQRAGLTSSDGSTGQGQINFNSLVSQNALVKSGDTFTAGAGWNKYWDDCSDTPFLSNGKLVVTYDDPDSLRDKAEFAVQAGLGGVGFWSIDGDTKTYDLIDSVRAGLQK